MTDIVVDKLEFLEHYLRQLEILKERDLTDTIQRAALERFLHLAAEACLDIGEIILARERAPRPQSYREVIRGLGALGILPSEFAARFEEVAGMRNVLVHDYARIDPAKLLLALQRLDDFRTFGRCIAEHVRRHTTPE